MIKKITLNNFQSHENTELEFCSGVNIFTGQSNSGKSSVLRGIFWAVNNRPVGESFISYWNKDEKGNIKNVTSVQIETNKRIVKRKKDKMFNGYVVDDEKEFEAIKTDVPEEIQRIFNLSDVNIQKQLSAPFLLSESGGEVARFFNKTIKLDLIDRMLSSVESKKRKTKSDIEKEEIELKKLKDSFIKLSWVEEAAELIDRANKTNDRLEDKRKIFGKLVTQIQDYRSSEFIFQKIQVNEAEKLLVECKEIMSGLEGKRKDHQRVSRSIENYLELKKSFEKYEKIDFVGISKKIDEYEKAKIDIKVKEEKRNDLKGSIVKIQMKMEELQECQKNLDKLEKQLPDICPLCGGMLKNN